MIRLPVVDWNNNKFFCKEQVPLIMYLTNSTFWRVQTPPELVEHVANLLGFFSLSTSPWFRAPSAAPGWTPRNAALSTQHP